MLNGEDENACVRNIVKEIMRECTSHKITVNKNFVTYLTKLLLMNPNWGIGDDFFNQRENVQHFVKYVIEELLSKEDDPRVVCLKIQFHYACNLDRMDYVIGMNRRDLKNRLKSLKDTICTAKANNYLFLKRIVYYITLATGLGNPKNPKVYEEALVALKSILDEEELTELNGLPKLEKQNRLIQLSQIVGGIRLFNKHCEKGGEGIADLPDLLNTASKAIRQGTESTLLLIMQKVNSLTTLIDTCHVMYKTPMGWRIEFEPPKGVVKANNINVEYMKDLLIFYRQYELLIRWLLKKMKENREKVATIHTSMNRMCKMIHNTVYMKLAIPVRVVFPLFEQLWGVWEQIQDQVMILSRLNVIISNLEDYSKLLVYDYIFVEQFIAHQSFMSDAHRLAETARCRLSSTNSEISVINSEDFNKMDNNKLEYLGFCVWKLKVTDGALIPGNPNMGVIVYKGKNYVFSCPDAFDEFDKEPQLYVNYVLDLARRKPQLINFFQLKEDLESVYGVEKLVESNISLKISNDKSMQTIDNTEESHIEHNYKWNVWDLKREALTMAKLCNAVTVSTQTDKTSSKNAIRCQTYYKKNLEVQTCSDAHTNVHKPSVFLYGLRGRTDDLQFKIDLTKPMEER